MAGLIHLVLKMLERSEAKVSRYVLRGVGRSNAAYLLGAPVLNNAATNAALSIPIMLII